MAIVSAKEMLLDATGGKYSVGAFNVTNVVQMRAVVEAAVRKEAPLIIQTSMAPTRFLGVETIAAVYHSIAESASIPICLHLDHCTDIELCKTAADAGYTNIMIDGSKQMICRTLKFYDELLSDMDFVRIHKSHLVNLRHIKRYKKGKGGQVIMTDDRAIDVSPSRKNELLQKFR